MDLNDCKKKGFIKKTAPNTNLIKSLIEMSDSKEITVNRADIDNVSISSYVSLAYDSLREILEAICLTKGYKVLSHLCLGELMRELVKDFDFTSFDRFRYIRNGVNYYGSKVDLEQGKEIIEKIFLMRASLKKKIFQTK
jgi:uncharacterized protein (UPF0332 family)